VLTTFQVYDSAVGWLLSADIAWKNLGLVELKGFPHAAEIFEPYEPRAACPQESLGAPSIYTRRTDGFWARLRRPIGREGVPPDWSEVLARGGVPRTASMERIDETILSGEREEAGDGVAFFPGTDQSLVGVGVDNPLSIYEELIRDWGGGRILWLADHPEANPLVGVLRRSGCVVDSATSTEEAERILSTTELAFVISDLGRISEETARLELLLHMKEAGWSVPTAIYASPSAAIQFKEEAKQLGAVACTSGAITLLHELVRHLRDGFAVERSRP
jgi:CheY-like chemotaxis protein